MALVRLSRPAASKVPPPRRAYGMVLGLPQTGASRAGSTYWKRMRRCPREHALHNLVRLRKRNADGTLVEASEALSVGALVHLGLEVYYRARLAGASDCEARVWEQLAPLRAEPGYEETYPEVERLLGAYFETYRHQDASWRVVAVEETLQYEDEDLAYSARLDLLIERDGGLWVVEHKTARAITADLVEGYQLDMQIVGQVWLLKVCVDLDRYPPLRGVLVNIITKQPTPRFERVEVCPSRDHLAGFEEAQRGWAAIEGAFSQVGWPKALGNCNGPARHFSTCDYFSLCHTHPRATVADLLASPAVPDGYVALGRENDNDDDDDRKP